MFIHLRFCRKIMSSDKKYKYNINGVLYGTKAFKIKNPNSNPGFKNMTKIVRFLIGGKGRRSGRRLLTNFQLSAFRTAGFDFSKGRRCERRLLTNSIASIPDDGY